MVNGNDIQEFEERNHEDLVEEFAREKKEDYDKYVLEQYNNYNADYFYTTQTEEDIILEEARERDFEAKEK